MSGPITPPLTVTTASGTPSGRPITTIKVSDGDLTISGGIATIDTSGSGGTPGGSDGQVQYNNAGAFGGDADFTFDGTTVTIENPCYINGDINSVVAGGADFTLIARDSTGGTVQGMISMGGGADEPITLTAGEAGSDADIVLIPGSGAGKTTTQSPIDSTTTIDADVVRIGAGTSGNEITTNTTEDLVLNTNAGTNSGSITITDGVNGDIDIVTDGTGVTEIQNSTTDNDTTLSVKGNGTGDSIINLNNPTKAVSLICDTNQKLKVQGGVNSFVFDASSATGGITFPDATELISAEGTAILATGITDGYVLTADGAGASGWEAAGGGGVTWPLEADSGSQAAPSYTFSTDTDTGIYLEGGNEIGFTTGGTRRVTLGSALGLEMDNNTRIRLANGTALLPSLTFGSDANTGIYRVAADTLGLTAGGVQGLRITEVSSTATVGISQGAVPSTEGDTGTAGDIAWDSDYFYICVATDTWKRTAIATW